MCPPGYHHNDFAANRTSCAQVHELPQNHYGDNRECTLFYILFHAHFGSVRFEHRGSLMTHLYIL